MTSPSPRPQDGLVEVWLVDLEVPASVLASHRLDLATDERARADRFLVEHARREFTVTRSVLRRLLAAALERSPDSLAFDVDENGKPSLRGGGLAFNVSHSHGRALIAIAASGTLGVDLEQVREEVAHERIGERYFSEPERAVLSALPEHEKAAAFFRCWSRKEAWLKAKGTGLRLSLAGFDVTLAPGEPARLLATRFDGEEAARWSLVELDAGPGFQAALAWLGETPVVKQHRWDEKGVRNLFRGEKGS